jgi:hypothetical protein
MRETKERKVLEELNIEELTADCVGRKIKMMKTVYSQEVNKIMSRRRVAQELVICTSHSS